MLLQDKNKGIAEIRKKDRKNKCYDQTFSIPIFSHVPHLKKR